MDPKWLSGKVALITGGGQGLGRGMALAMARAGADVAIAGRTQSKLDRVVAEIQEVGCRAIGIQGDVCSPGDLSRIVDGCLEQLGGIDVLVNNAQQTVHGRIDELSDADFETTFLSGPFASFRLMKLVHPHMASRGGGVMFNVASTVGEAWDVQRMGAYGSAKEAIRYLTRVAAAEWGRDRIRVLCIAPTAMTDGMEKWSKAFPGQFEEGLRSVPLGRYGDPEMDIGRAVALLVADEAGYLTGATIPLDGGQANFN
jgi:NAD(P)-dependent dehydrogenase (short-subunit alcohol dehydrogenase family)